MPPKLSFSSFGLFHFFVVNTAARLESTGAPNQVHLSQETVDLLLLAGKTHLATMREDKVNAKGKGVLNTFWLKTDTPDLAFSGFSSEASTDVGSTTSSATREDRSMFPSAFEDKNQGLVDWNVNILKRSLVEIVAHREACQVKPAAPEVMHRLEKEYMKKPTSLKEVKEIVSLPKYNAGAVVQLSSGIVLDDTVMGQLQSYVFNLSTMYKDNPFHNWEQ